MEIALFLIALAIVALAVYKLMLRRLGTPQATVRALLRNYHSLARSGLDEQEILLQILVGRSGWKDLPPALLGEIVARLKSKENLFRFLSLAEGYRFDKQELPPIAAKNHVQESIREIAIWLVDFGARMQRQNRLKEAEFVQKLALDFEPNQHFTKLPLAMTYYKMEKYTDAIPLFEAGLADLDKHAAEPTIMTILGAGGGPSETRAIYEDAYRACLKAAPVAEKALPCRA